MMPRAPIPGRGRLTGMVRGIVLLWLALTGSATAAATYTANPSKDSWINESSPTQNNGAATTLRATSSSSNTSRTRALIAFTMPSIGATEVITSAVLNLRVTTSSTQAVAVHRITSSWSETTVTWNSAIGYNATAETSLTPSTAGVTVSIDITSLVQAWRAGTYANNGVILLGQASSTAQFASNEATSTPRPQLVITTVVPPVLTLLKSSSVLSDPLNGTTNPKAIPGSVITYTVTAGNNGSGTADSGSTYVTDAIPANAELFVGNLGGAGSGPVAFTNGSVSSGLSYTFTSLASTTDSPSFSNNGGTSFGYTPVADANGYDAAVTHIRVSPAGTFAAKTGVTSPSFTLQMRMRVK
jgi:uncharacterized repeat protein (TIGR01451 family)